MYRFLNIFFLLLFSCSGNVIFAQNPFKSIKYNVQTGGIIASKKNIPFFLHSNSFGTIPFQSNSAFLAFSLFKQYDSLYTTSSKLKKFGYGYGLNVYTNLSSKSQFLLPEFFIKLRYGGIEIYGGRRKEIQGLVDTTLSSGAYVVSGNALPIPKIQISTPNWLGFGKYKRFSVNTGLSHGWFGTQGIIENYFEFWIN